MAQKFTSLGDESSNAFERDETVPTKNTLMNVLRNPFAVFTEWTEEADEKAYADL